MKRFTNTIFLFSIAFQWCYSQCIQPELMDQPGVVCQGIVDPVCGCDGNTYPNSCYAELFNGVAYWTPGACSCQTDPLTAEIEAVSQTDNFGCTYITSLVIHITGNTPPSSDWGYEWNDGFRGPNLPDPIPGQYYEVTITNEEQCTTVEGIFIPDATCECVPPSNFSEEVQTDPTKVRIMWDETPGATKYQMRYKQNGEDWMTKTVFTPYTIIGNLNIHKHHKYKIRSWCQGVWSAWSTPEHFVATDCPFPLQSSTAVQTDGSILVQWDEILGATDYEILYRLSGSTGSFTKQLSGGDTQINLDNLNDGATYEYRLRSFCSTTFGALSTPFYFTYLSNLRLTQPDGFIFGKIYPVPSKDELTLEFSLEEENEVTLSIINTMGMSVMEETGKYFEGGHYKQLNISHLEPGFYLLNIKYGKRIITKRFLKIKD